MGTSIHIQKQFEDLQRDAEHVLSTISSLSQNLGSEGKARAVAASEEAVARMRSEFETVKKKLDETRQLVADKARDVDAQVHARPYPYIAGALGVGALAGWLLERRIHTHPSDAGR